MLPRLLEGVGSKRVRSLQGLLIGNFAPLALDLRARGWLPVVSVYERPGIFRERFDKANELVVVSLRNWGRLHCLYS